MPLAVKVGQMPMGSDMPPPVLHEKIGRGASGAIVWRCTFGTFTAAAKVLFPVQLLIWKHFAVVCLVFGQSLIDQ